MEGVQIVHIWHNACHGVYPLFNMGIGQKIGYVKEMLLSKALTCMNFYCVNKNGFFIMETDTFGYIHRGLTQSQCGVILYDSCQ